jgi:ABC-2 type transport system ATP-binding protein
MIEIRGISKRFPGAARPALEGIDLTVPEGTVLGLVGRNGAGKSTLLRLVAGISRPTRGRIIVGGRDVTRQKVAASRHIGWVPETPRFELDERALPFLIHLALLDGRSRAGADRRARTVLDRVGFEPDDARPIRILSQGQLRRLALAAAWLEEPDHLLYDEVTNGLDLPGKALLADSLADLRQRGGVAILASHRMDEVEAWCDQIAVLQDGRVVATVPGRSAGGHARRHLRLLLDRPAEERLGRLRELGKVTLTEATALLEADAPPGRDVVAELVGEGYHLREVRSMRSDLAEYLGESEP